MNIINSLKFTVVIIIISIILTPSVTSSEIEWEELKNINLEKLETNSDDLLARFEYAIALANLGQVEESYEQFDILGEEETKGREVIKEHKQNLEQDSILKLNYRAFLALTDAQYEQSIDYFYDIIELDPENVWIYNYLAASYLELEEYEAAKEILDQALEIKDNGYSHLIYGIIYWENGQYINAARSFSRSGKIFDILRDHF